MMIKFIKWNSNCFFWDSIFVSSKGLLLSVVASVSVMISAPLLADNVVSCKAGAFETASVVTTTAHLTDNNDGTISDSKTGLMWKKCPEGYDWNQFGFGLCGASSQTSFNWKNALLQAQQVNGGTGENFTHTDWRLPNIKELQSVAEMRCNNPATNATVFPDMPELWSSSPLVGSAAQVWRFSAYYGEITYSDKDSTISVRLVRDQ